MSLPPTLVQILMCHKGNVYLSCSNSECRYDEIFDARPQSTRRRLAA